jgi:hypothetical protein
VGIRVRKLADYSDGQRVHRFDPVTGVRYLVDPNTNEAKPWPLLGVEFEVDPPQTAEVGMTWAANAAREGWLELENEQIVHRPGGPTNDKWAITHTFRHADALVFKTVKGDVRYRVTHQPDKYVAEGDDSTPVTDEEYASGNTRVDWVYRVELEE